MKTLDSEGEKVKKLCDALRRDTIEPAQAEAREVVSKAHRQAEEIIEQARQAAVEMEAAAKERIEQERAVFTTSLEQASRQGIELLRQAVEEKILCQELHSEIVSATIDPKIVAKIVSVVIEGIEREGIESDLSALIARAVDPEAVNRHLAKQLLDRLREGGVLLDGFGGGAQIVMRDEKITLDITDEALLELLGRFLRGNFRELLFRAANG